LYTYQRVDHYRFNTGYSASAPQVSHPGLNFHQLTKNDAGAGICPAARRRGVSRSARVAFTLSKALDEEEQA
jgi:hypothetical protein